jgi:hypothetical protein
MSIFYLASAQDTLRKVKTFYTEKHYELLAMTTARSDEDESGRREKASQRGR